MHTQEPWILGIDGNDACHDPGHIMSRDGLAIADCCLEYSSLIESEQEANARRIVACVNACAGIPAEKLEGKTIDEYIANEAYLTGVSTNNGLDIGLKGGACQMLAEAFAGQFVGSGATNFLEVGLASEKTGPLIVTIQRVFGKTPSQLKQEAERQRDELLVIAREAVRLLTAQKIRPDGIGAENRLLAAAMAAIDKCEAGK